MLRDPINMLEYAWPITTQIMLKDRTPFKMLRLDDGFSLKILRLYWMLKAERWFAGLHSDAYIAKNMHEIDIMIVRKNTHEN